MHSAALSEHLRPVETALADIPALAMTDSQATRLSQGQVVQVLGTEGSIAARSEEVRACMGMVLTESLLAVGPIGVCPTLLGIRSC